jgi:hypothetical protein
VGTAPVSSLVYTGAGTLKSLLIATNDVTITHMNYVSIFDNSTLLAICPAGITFGGFTSIDLPFTTNLKFSISGSLTAAAITTAGIQVTFVYSH